MLSIDKALELVDLEAIQQEIVERRTLIGDMVGNLYPRILNDEIEKLQRRLANGKLFAKWMKMTR